MTRVWHILGLSGRLFASFYGWVWWTHSLAPGRGIRTVWHVPGVSGLVLPHAGHFLSWLNSLPDPLAAQGHHGVLPPERRAHGAPCSPRHATVFTTMPCRATSTPLDGRACPASGRSSRLQQARKSKPVLVHPLSGPPGPYLPQPTPLPDHIGRLRCGLRIHPGRAAVVQSSARYVLPLRSPPSGTLPLPHRTPCVPGCGA